MKKMAALISSRTVGTPVSAAFVAALTVLLSLGLLSPVLAEDSRVPMPNVTIHNGDKCVEDTEVMRRSHMEFILHQRDRTVHEGIRTKQHSLKNCINCHADPQTQSVLGEDGFCQSCHVYASVKMDCFGCHSSKAEEQIGQRDPESSMTRSLQRPQSTRVWEPRVRIHGRDQ